MKTSPQLQKALDDLVAANNAFEAQQIGRDIDAAVDAFVREVLADGQPAAAREH